MRPKKEDYIYSADYIAELEKHCDQLEEDRVKFKELARVNQYSDHSAFPQDLYEQAVEKIKELEEKKDKYLNCIDVTSDTLYECVNELCLKCGNYELGDLCNNCKWKEYK